MWESSLVCWVRCSAVQCLVCIDVDTDFYYSTTLTYFEITHAQWKLHMALVGVVDRRGRWERTICSVHGPF